MPTRRQDPDQKRFCQEAFASSADNDRGLLGNLVAVRCYKLTDREEIALLWWLQQVSWRDGGLEKFADAFIAANQSRIGTLSMHKFGMRKGQIYNADQVRAVRTEICRAGAYPLRGERKEEFDLSCLLERSIEQELADRQEERDYPDTYPVAAFIEACECDGRQLTEILQDAAVNPASASLREGLPNFPHLWAALGAWRQQEIEATRGRIVETEVSTKVFAALDYAHESKCFVLVEGREGIGKSMSAKAWCDQHSGEAVYVSLESGTDETTLFRSIARALGTAFALSRNAGDIKARIEEALLPGHLTLVLDEAHFLWPQSYRAQRSAPKRMDWLRTALIDHGVPVALLSTPQYFTQQCTRFRKAGWNSNQIQRRLAHTVILPEALGKADALAMARHYFPAATATEAKRIALLAALTRGFLTTMIHLRKRVDFLASRRGQASAAELLSEAINEVCEQQGITLDAPGSVVAPAVQQPGKPLSKALQRPGNAAPVVAPSRATAPPSLSRIHREQPALSMT